MELQIDKRGADRKDETPAASVPSAWTAERQPAPAAAPRPPPARPASDEDCAVVGGRGLCRGHGSGGTDGMEGPARRHPGETRRSGTSRARRGCGFVKKCDFDFSAGNSERREPLLGSLVPATFSFLFTLSMERGKISLSGELLALGRK